MDDSEVHLDAFLGPTGTFQEGSLPTIPLHYKNTYNDVDMFNRQLERLSWPLQKKKDKQYWLIQCISMAAVNAWGLWLDHEQQNHAVAPHFSLRNYTRQVGEHLLCIGKE